MAIQPFSKNPCPTKFLAPKDNSLYNIPMTNILRKDCDTIVASSIKAVLPDSAVQKALQSKDFRTALENCRTKGGKVILVAAGKAAWAMANAAYKENPLLDTGIVITKYGHSMGAIAEKIRIKEAAHPVPDDATFAATREVLELTSGLSEHDLVLFLLSGGGSALFEEPLVKPAELQAVTKDLLASGAEITEINTIRKRLSAVKGGRFAEHCAPAKVFSVILSDVLGDRLDMIASGPTVADTSTCQEALAIVKKYNLAFPPAVMECLAEETPKSVPNAENQVFGSVAELVKAAADSARACGYKPVILTDSLTCEAREAGSMLGSVAAWYSTKAEENMAFIAGGETVVHLTGTGKGGRNQELALAAAPKIDGLSNAAVFSVGSDGTDGPTDAAGGFADGSTCALLREAGLKTDQILADNNAYFALQKTGGLIITGPTGTNVNDVSVVLIRKCP